MHYDWITIALQNNGTLALSQLEDGKLRADMHWPEELEVLGLPADTVPEAIDKLNNELHEDAARLMIAAGSV
jgi:hypothetical protein